MAHTIDLRKKPAKENSDSLGVAADSGIISWEAPSFHYNPRKRYLVLTVIVLLFGAGAMLFYDQDPLLAIFLILSSFALILYGNKRPEISTIVINGAGVSIDDRLYFYKDLKSFWLDYEPQGLRELSLESRKWYLPYVKVSIEDTNPLEIRGLMIDFVPEREHEKSLIDHIGKKLGL